MKQVNIDTISQMLVGMEHFQEVLEDIIQNEQKCFNGLSERFQLSERGEQYQEKLELLQEAADSLTEVITNCYSAIEE